MKRTSMSNGIRKEINFSPITLDKLYMSENQKPGTITAQLRQVVTTTSFYPSKKVETEKQSGLFSLEDFGFVEKDYDSVEERIAWVPVPVNATEEQVKAVIASNPTGVIYKVISNEPILDENQKYGITQGLRTLDHYANAQVVRYPENEKTLADGTANQIVKDKADNVQYRRTFYWKTDINDHDLRDASKVYVSPELMAEMHGASILEGQSVE